MYISVCAVRICTCSVFVRLYVYVYVYMYIDIYICTYTCNDIINCICLCSCLSVRIDLLAYVHIRQRCSVDNRRAQEPHSLQRRRHRRVQWIHRLRKARLLLLSQQRRSFSGISESSKHRNGQIPASGR